MWDDLPYHGVLTVVLLLFFRWLPDFAYYIGALAIVAVAINILQTMLIYFKPCTLSQYLRTTPSGKSWALVTGASDGIGRELAQGLCQRGFNVIIHGRNEKKLEGVKAQLNETFPKCEVQLLIADAVEPIASESDLLAPIQNLPITVLINNLGSPGGMLYREYTMLTEHRNSDIPPIMNINATFPTQLTRALLPVLRRNGPALLLNIGSGGAIGTPYLAVYSGAKAFIRFWSKGLRRELTSEAWDVEILYVNVGMVKSWKYNQDDSDFLAPSPKTMANCTLDRVGCGVGEVTPYWPHLLLTVAAPILPDWVLSRLLINTMKMKREAGMKKLAG